MAQRRLATILLCILLWLLLPLPLNRAAAAPRPDVLPQTAPCYTAAVKALTKKGAIYSQGGELAGDPINPNTGQAYPRTGPDSFDCSGLVWWAYAQAGISIGKTTYTQINNGVGIPCRLADLNGSSTSCWALGDLVFLSYSGGQHVAIYVGNGLFMDCYNLNTGCILHNVKNDSFYQAHFWQARRIVSGCDGTSYVPGAPTQPSGGEPQSDSAFSYYAPPQWDTLPDLVGYVSFPIPQCVAFNGLPPLNIAPYRDPVLDWDTYSITAPFFWLADIGWNLIRGLVCRLFDITQYTANIMALLTNTFLGVVNIAWKVGVFGWLTLRAWLYAGWFLYEIVRDWMYNQISTVFAWILAWLTAFSDVFAVIADVISVLGDLVLQLLLLPLNLLGWIGGLAFDLINAILLAVGTSETPEQLTSTHPIYEATHGALQAINDSSFGWLLYLLYAMAYVAFISWLARFLSASPAEK